MFVYNFSTKLPKNRGGLRWKLAGKLIPIFLEFFHFFSKTQPSFWGKVGFLEDYFLKSFPCPPSSKTGRTALYSPFPYKVIYAFAGAFFNFQTYVLNLSAI